jgi:hypothetical protein
MQESVMEKKSSPILRLVGLVLGLALLISLIVLVVGLVFQWNSSIQFSNAFFVAGAIAILIGTFSVTGGLEQRGNFGMTYAESAGQASIHERTQRMMADINQRYGVLILMTGTGILLIAISVAVPRLF